MIERFSSSRGTRTRPITPTSPRPPNAPTIYPVLNPDDWSKLGGLYFAARRVADGLHAGSHPSARRGPGLDFHDYRPYCPGDDPGRIDWKLFGRTDRYYLRRYHQLTDLPTHVMVDRTASMGFAGLSTTAHASRSTKHPTKFHYAKLLAATIAFLAVRHGDQIALSLFTDQLTAHVPAGSTPAHLRRVCTTLERAPVADHGGDLGSAIASAVTATQRRGLFIIISDLLDDPDPFFDGLNRLRHLHFDVIVFQVLTRDELSLTRHDQASLRLIDPETNASVSTRLPTVRDRYAQLISQHLATLQRGCVARGVDYQLVTPDQPIPTALRLHLARRARNMSAGYYT